ncbi:hypothetical protein EKI60_03055 [Candidatus Saccharibacteria bacterium]|nr:MAG: hypothetical protein EKI60_03055 [Candidatus Saccharibacteria bacterium]
MAKEEIPTAPELPGSKSAANEPDDVSEADLHSEVTDTEEPEVSEVDDAEAALDPVPVSRTPAPRMSREEALLRSASKNMEDETDDQAPIHPKSVTADTKKGHKKLWVSLLIIVLLAGAAVAVWYFVLRDKQAVGNGQENKPTSQQQQTLTYEPESVAYAFRANNTDPYTIYSRPALGGERKEALTLPRDAEPLSAGVVGKTVAFTADKSVYVSTDGGQKYTKVYDVASGEDITSAQLSRDGTRIAIATLDQSSDSKGKAISVNLEGKDTKQLFSAEEAAIFMIGWNDKKQQAVYREGCFQCDGTMTKLKVRDLKSGKSNDILSDADLQKVGGLFDVSDDLTQFIYVENTVDKNTPVDNLWGYYVAAPYKVTLVDIAAKKSSVLATIGSKGEKNANGTDKYRSFYMGFVAGTNTPYYAEGNDLFTVKAGSAEKAFTGDKPVWAVPFVGKDQIFVATADAGSMDFTLSSFTIADKETSLIFEGDANTVILGISTK